MNFTHCSPSLLLPPLAHRIRFCCPGPWVCRPASIPTVKQKWRRQQAPLSRDFLACLRCISLNSVELCLIRHDRLVCRCSVLSAFSLPKLLQTCLCPRPSTLLYMQFKPPFLFYPCVSCLLFQGSFPGVLGLPTVKIRVRIKIMFNYRFRSQFPLYPYRRRIPLLRPLSLSLPWEVGKVEQLN